MEAPPSLSEISPSTAATEGPRLDPLSPLGPAAPRRSRLWLHALLFATTAATLTLLGGIPYALCVIAILLSHEMGHYLACRYYGIRASLPYFIPAPPPFPFGTLGAVIRIRGAIPTRKALFDVAAAGPLAGFAVALPILIVGLLQATPVSSISPEDTKLGTPLICYVLQRLLFPQTEELLVGNVFYAGWFGLLVTSLNLFPVGQLDGGHAVYAVSRKLHRILARVTLVAMLGFVAVEAALRTLPQYAVWCVVLLLMRDRHPRLVDEATPLGRGRALLALLLLVLFAVSFIPRPF